MRSAPLRRRSCCLRSSRRGVALCGLVLTRRAGTATGAARSSATSGTLAATAATAVSATTVGSATGTGAGALGSGTLLTLDAGRGGLALVDPDPVSYTHLTLPTNREV